MTFRTGTEFSGLSTYANNLSKAQPGALQTANDVVIDSPGIISPRRGQRPYALYNINLLTANEATGGDTLLSTAGFFVGQQAAYNTPSVSPTLALVGPDATQAWQGLYCSRVFGLAPVPTDGVALLASLPAGTYTFSAYTRAQGSAGLHAILKIIDSANTVLVTNTTAILSSLVYTRISGTFTLGAPASIQIGMTLDVGNDNILYFDGLQLEANAFASLWTAPQGLVCSRLFQVRDNLYGFFTADGLPTSPGRFIRVVDTVDGGTRPLDVTAAFSNTPNAFYPPPANAVHSLQVNGNTLFTTNDGIMKLLAHLTGADSGTIVPAGMPLALDTRAALSPPAAGTLGWLKGGYAAAYRVVWGNTDPQGNLTLGAPSPAVILENPKLTNQALLYAGGTFASYRSPAFEVTVTLPYTPNSNFTYNVSVVQGSLISQGIMSVLNGNTTATIRLTDVAHYFGPVGTPVTVVANLTVLSATASPQTLTFTAGVVQSTAWAGTTTLYQPFNAATAGDTSGAINISSVVTAPSNATVTTITGTTFTTGPIGLIQACTIQAAQLSQVFVYETSAFFTLSSPIAGDSLALPGVADQSIVDSVNLHIGTAGGQPINALNLDAFPEGLILNGSGLFDVYQPENASVSFVVPPEAYLYTAASTGQVTTSFYQVYRSHFQQPIVAGVITQPTDDMRLAYQAEITGSSGAHIITIIDIAPDATLGATIYTSPAEEGILASRYQPPVASDMSIYQECALYANCWTPARFSSQLLAVSGVPAATASLQPGDTVTINGISFTAQAGGLPAGPNPFAISFGSGSATADNSTTVANLSRAVNNAYVAVINGGATTETVALLSTAEPTSMGGTFTIQAMRGLGSFTFTWTAGSGTGHSSPFQQLPTSAVLPEQLQNALFYSPAALPEAVPLGNELNIGETNYPIQRILALPGSAIIFKDYESFFQLSGATSEQFSVQQHNTSIQLLSNESAVKMQSQLVAFTNQGVVTVTTAGVQIVSLAVNDQLLALTKLPAFAATSFGVAHEEERHYHLWAPTDASDTLPTQAFIYNMLTGAWVRWTLPRVCGLANVADQLLYTGSAVQSPVYGNSMLYREATTGPTGSDLNFGDELVSGTYTVVDSTHGTFTGFLAGQGAAIVAAFGQGSALNSGGEVVFPSTIVLTNSTTLTLTFPAAVDLATGAAALVQATVCEWAPIPIYGDDTGSVKQFQEFVVNFNATTTQFMSATTGTDFGLDSTVLPLRLFGQARLNAGGWGIGGWGEIPWGGQTPALLTRAASARQLVPRGTARGHAFFPTVTCRCALSTFEAQGLTLAWTPLKTTRTR